MFPHLTEGTLKSPYGVSGSLFDVPAFTTLQLEHTTAMVKRASGLPLRHKARANLQLAIGLLWKILKNYPFILLFGMFPFHPFSVKSTGSYQIVKSFLCYSTKEHKAR